MNGQSNACCQAYCGIVDTTGHGLFNCLLQTTKTMKANFKYLKNITPK
jgi:hypothetical protein